MTVVWHHENSLRERHVSSGRFRMIGVLGISVCVLFGGVGGGWFFFKGWSSGIFPPMMERILYVPIGYEDDHIVWFPRVARLTHGIAAASGRALVTEPDYAQAIDTVVRQNALADLVHEEHIDAPTVNPSSVQWTDDIRTLMNLAGWNTEEYLVNIQQPFLLANAVSSAVLADEKYQTKAHVRMNDIQSKLNIGIAFADVAQEYSEDPVTAPARGSFGYVLPADVDAAFAAVFFAPAKTVSDVINTQHAYWLLRIDDTVASNDGTRFLLRGIAIRKQTLTDTLDDKTSAIVPKLWVR